MSNSNTIRVLLVDDHTIVREGLATLIDVIPDLELVGEAANGLEAVQLCAAHQPDVVLMDLMMPKMDGVSAIPIILEENPAIRIVALTSFVDKEMVQSVLAAGAAGYLLKDVSANELAAAIRTANMGKPIMAPEAMQELIQAQKEVPSPGHDLTKRELQVLERMVPGLTNAQIAQELSISASTVKNHVSNILSKMNASSRTEAVKLAMQYKLVDVA